MNKKNNSTRHDQSTTWFKSPVDRFVRGGQTIQLQFREFVHLVKLMILVGLRPNDRIKTVQTLFEIGTPKSNTDRYLPPERCVGLFAIFAKQFAIEPRVRRLSYPDRRLSEINNLLQPMGFYAHKKGVG